MRAFVDVLRFELRQQCRAPLFLGVVAVFFLIHLMTMASVGINLNDNQLININSPYLIVRTELVLGVFGMLPAMLFVVNAATRDHELGTAELFFTTPVARLPFLLGRLSGGTLCALLAGVAGLLGTLTGSFMPWLDPGRLGPFSWLPYAHSLLFIVVPTLLVVCVFSFAVAVLSRSQALTFAVALGFVVLELTLNSAAGRTAPGWLALLDPFAALTVEAASRYWTVADLNTRLPTALLPENRLLWLGLALVVLVLTCRRFRLELPAVAGRPRRLQATPQPGMSASSNIICRGSFTRRDTLAQFMAQLRMDLRAVILGPLFCLVLLFVVTATISEFQGNTDLLIGLPVHPLTGLMLGFFRFGLLMFVLMVVIFYSGTLTYRERDHGLHDIVSASPYPDWIMVLSKTMALCLVISVLLLVSMLTSIGMQALAGYYDFELKVYLQGLFIYNGFYFYMLCVLAVLVQILSPGKWSGMLLLFCVLVALLSLEPLGFEHLLYGFRIPFVIYSDMNGFGHFQTPTRVLIGYWSVFCAMLLVVGHLLFPRGTYAGVRARLRDARSRMTASLILTTTLAMALFAGIGAWIYWNTNILNRYQTAESRLHQAADYERKYAGYKALPGPALQNIALEVDLYPEERRLESRGRATLGNTNREALSEFVVSADPRLLLNALEVEGATVSLRDAAQGFYVFRLEPPLQPGDSRLLRWNATRWNRGFVNSAPDNEIVANGTFVKLSTIMPLPAYDLGRDITENSERRRMGLPRAARLPTLGDPAWLGTLGFGIDSRVDFRVIFSTAADQTAVAPGVLEREWQDNGRHYFEYVMEAPIWPVAALSSARYTVVRDQWHGVALEVYHEAKHPWNVGIMIDTAKQALDYFTREFAPYPFHSFRILEYPRYSSAAQGFPGTIPYSESAGFLTDLSTWTRLDYTTIHELAHQWWGGMAYGARMQGRQMLNETLAQYSTLMVFKQQDDPVWLRRILASLHDGYLNGRGNEGVAEQSLLRTEDQGNISYNKGALVMFALQDLIGAQRMHQALRSYLHKFALQPPPFPTSRDLVNELRTVAGPEYQTLITDLFEKLMLYDVEIVAAEVREDAGAYDVTLDIRARQFEADGMGAEKEVPLDTWFDVAIFPTSEQDLLKRTPLYQAKHRGCTAAPSGCRCAYRNHREPPGLIRFI